MAAATRRRKRVKLKPAPGKPSKAQLMRVTKAELVERIKGLQSLVQWHEDTVPAKLLAIDRKLDRSYHAAFMEERASRTAIANWLNGETDYQMDSKARMDIALRAIRDGIHSDACIGGEQCKCIHLLARWGLSKQHGVCPVSVEGIDKTLKVA